MRTIGLLVVVATMFPAGLAAQETRSPAAGAKPPVATIAHVAWLAGTWRGEGLGAQATEVYSAPDGGQITGHFTQVKDRRVVFYELMQIVPVGRSLVYRLRHFAPDLTGWEDAKQGKAVEFPLIAIEKDALFFDGMTFRRTGTDTMDVIVRIDGGKKGTHEARFRYRRVAS